jgi:hypothetical protein
MSSANKLLSSGAMILLLTILCLLSRSVIGYRPIASGKVMEKYKSKSHIYSGMRRTISRVNALKEGVLEQIEQLRKDLVALESDDSWKKLAVGSDERNEIEEKLKYMRLVDKCATALADIDRDLLTFQDHLEGDDEKLKEIAKSFTQEFLECKEQIETQLNSIVQE